MHFFVFFAGFSVLPLVAGHPVSTPRTGFGSSKVPVHTNPGSTASFDVMMSAIR